MAPRARRNAAADPALDDLDKALAAQFTVTAEEQPPLDLADDVPGEDAPPLPPGPKRRAGSMQKQLEAMYATAGSMVYMFDPVIGSTIVQQSSHCAEALDELAKTNPKVRKALMNMLTTSAWSGVVVAHMPIVMAVASQYVPQMAGKFRAPQESSDEGQMFE